MTDEKCLIETLNIVRRNGSELLDLPHRYRWEFTRRHPYYQLCWRLAEAYRRNRFTAGTVENVMGLTALYLLGLIGVTGMPMDPKLTFQEVNAGAPDFLSGTVQPMTFRNMLLLIINALPPAELQVVAAALRVASSKEYAEPNDEDFKLQTQKAQDFLMQITSSHFDSYPDAPLYYIHVDAAQRRIREDLETYVRRWKQRRDIPERRTRLTGLDEDLRIWDMREGWKNGSYDHAAENSFGSIQAALRRAKSTVVNSYRAAFRRITGHEFSPEMWMRVFGSYWLLQSDGEAYPMILRRFRTFMIKNQPKPVPESKLQSEDVEHGLVGLVESESAIEGIQDSIDLEMDVLELIERNWSNERIANELEISSTVVAYLRERLTDLKTIDE